MSDRGATAERKGRRRRALLGLRSCASGALAQRIYMHFTPVVVQIHTVYPAAFFPSLFSLSLCSCKYSAPSQDTKVEFLPKVRA